MQFRTSESLPIDSFLNQIRSSLDQYSTCIVVAEPGAGKTTHLPPYLVTNFIPQNKSQDTWWVIEPRRWAAKESARRIAEEQGWRLGDDVGYQVRLENKTTRTTKLIFQTEGIFLKRLLDDPSLTGVSGIILDEFHERSANLDLAAFALKEIIRSLRPDLKLLVLSATLDAEKLSKYFMDAPIHNVPGRMFPVVIQYDECADRPIDWAKKILKHQEEELDTLVFLPGSGEIERVSRDLSSLGHQGLVLKLFSRLEEKEQKIVFDKNRESAIILSTNIAETSITLPRVGTVIDTGTVKITRFEPSSGLNKLVLTKISTASAKQRSGRAGRVRPGRAIRLWSESEQMQKRAYETPEILRTELSQSVLWLKAWGEKNLDQVTWIDVPARARVEEAILRLKLKGLLSETGDITSDGTKVLDWGIDPSLGPLLIEGSRSGCLEWTARLAAWMETASRDVHSFEDLDRELSNLTREAKEIASRWSQMKSLVIKTESVPKDPRIKAMLLALADRVWIDGTLISGTRIVSAGRLNNETLPQCGIAFRIQEDSSGYAKIFSYVALDIKTVRLELAALVREEVHIEYDSSAKRLRAKKASWIGKAAISAVTEIAVDPIAAGEWFYKNGDRDGLFLSLLGEEQARWKLFSALAAESKLNKVMPLEEWKALVWHECTRGKKTVDEISTAIQLREWAALIPYEQKQLFERECPAKLEVPSGSFIRLQYDEGLVRCSVRLQEVFGWIETPRIAFGRMPITIELLSPSYKPVQTTQDLASFWRGTYFEVRKELRSKYPKHSWPEDPLTATPVAKGRRRF